MAQLASIQQWLGERQRSVPAAGTNLPHSDAHSRQPMHVLSLWNQAAVEANQKHLEACHWVHLASASSGAAASTAG